VPGVTPSQRPAVFAERCGTCVFRPGNLLDLRPGRFKSVVDRNLEAGALLPCHETTHGQADREVMCRGFYDAYGEQVNVVRVMDRFADGRSEWLDEVPCLPGTDVIK
jgi:hypothetical protein